jgi:protein-disulfide isomerase
MSEPAQLTVPVSERDHATGPVSAPLVLVEYGDYECPHCRDAYPVVKQLRDAFGDALTFVYRNFPLTSLHAHAQRAAETAEWAALSGKFWPMHDHLFEHARRLDDKGLLAAAAALGLDPHGLQQAWDSHALIPQVKGDFLGGLKSGVTGTPKFFINGRRHDGLSTAEALREALAAALAAAP